MKANKLFIALSFLLVGCVPGTTPPPSSAETFGGNTAPNPQDTSYTPPADDSDGSGSGGESGVFNPGGNPANGDAGSYLPEALAFCGTQGQIVLQKGQSTLLEWHYPNNYVPPQALTLTLESTPGGIVNIGTITPVSVLSALYTAPASVPQEFTVSVRAALQDSSSPSVCQVRLVRDGGLGVEDDGTTRGPVGNVYPLPVNQPRLPDFALMTSVASILVPNFDVPERAFSMGFPGVEDLFEWFGIRFEGRLVVPTTGTYALRITSDDGSILWIDGQKVIDNDGVHAPRTVNADYVLTAGNHPFRLDYYQGPRYLIQLQLLWKKPGDSAHSIVPPDAFLRPE